jgi:hypothetical protein
VRLRSASGLCRTLSCADDLRCVNPVERAVRACITEAEIRCHGAFEAPKEIKMGVLQRLFWVISLPLALVRCHDRSCVRGRGLVSYEL